MNLATASGAAAVSAVGALLNGGSLIFYSGTQPATPETALSGNTALATFTFAATAFGSGADVSNEEQLTASFVASSVTPAANGTATFARGLKSDGTTAVADFTVGTTGTDIVLSTNVLATTTQVSLTSFILEIPVS
jgi:hypothetical protein